MNRKIKAVIFDAGGVVTEWRRHMARFADENKIEIDDFIRAVKTYEDPGCRGLIDSDEYCRAIMKYLDKAEDWQKLRKVYPWAFTPIKETYSLLGELKGKYHLALLTNATKGSVDEIDIKLHHKHFFEMIIDSSAVGLIKPEKEIFLLACPRLKLSPRECLFIDDDEINIKAAKKLGFVTVHFTDPKESAAKVRKFLELS